MFAPDISQPTVPLHNYIKRGDDNMTGEDPRIVISGENTLESEYTITIDNGIEVLTSRDFLYAIFYLFASFWIFNIEYPKTTKTFRSFM